MKKFLLLIIIVFYNTISYSQNDIFGNSPVKEVTPIKRGDFQSNSSNLNKISTESTNITTSTPTGSSTEVGVTEGQLSVSLTGGANYSIPIIVTPGINGVVPQISLSYNSQGGNGLAGYGWNVSGVSVITRISATKFHDGAIDVVDFNSMDRFAFDGQRLVVKSGPSSLYGANGTLYETESFSNVQITSYGVHPNGANYGPEYFIVQYPDGSIAHYGNSATSRSLTDWAVTYWQNPQGVRINYNYIISDNNLSISTITYGSRLSITPINEISFVYDTRQRPEQAYIGSQSFIRSTILKEIKVKGNNVGFRNYVLAHETTSLGYQRLKSITEKSGDNTKSYNPTVFNYEVTSNNDLFQISNPITLNVNDINYATSSNISGDFNGDGNMDFILYPTAGNDAKKKYWLYTDIQGTSTNIGTEHSLGTFTEIFPTSWLSGNNKLMPMQGWCTIQTNTTTNVTTFNNYSTGIVNPIYFQYARNYEFPRFSYTMDCPNLFHCDLSPAEFKILEDEKLSSTNRGLGIDPDPIDPDPTTLNCTNPSNIVLTSIDNNEATISWDVTGTPLPAFYEVYYFETGTGTPPLNTDPVGTYSTTNQNSFTVNGLDYNLNYSFFIRSVCSVGSDNIPNDWYGPFVTGANPIEFKYVNIPKEYLSGDFNGDGLTDVIVIEKNTSYKLPICQEDCYTTQNVIIPGGTTYFVNLDRRITNDFVNISGNISITNWSKFTVADVNGDGKSDLMVFDQGTVKVYYLNSNNQLIQMTNQSDGSILADKPRYMGDFNGDGKMDFVIPQAVNVDSWSFFFSKGNSFQKVTNGIGFSYVTSQLVYKGIVGWPVETTKSLEEVAFIANDINGDGKTDIILQANYTVECYATRYGCGYDDTYGSPQVTLFRVFENKGFNGTSISFNQVYVNAQVGGIKRYPMPLFLDHNNLNQNLEYGLISGNSIRTFKSTKDNRKDTRLKEIILGSGVKEVITYSPLNAYCNLPNNCDVPYEPSTYTENYPNFDLKVANSLQIVSKLEHVSATQHKKQKFKYYGAVSNMEGIGFLGFRGLSRTNWFNDDNPVISTVSIHDITKRGAINETFTVLGEIYGSLNYTPTDFISKTNMTYVDQLLSNKVYKISNPSTITLNNLNGTSKEVTSTFDSFNNPLITTSISKNGANVEGTEIINMDYYPAANSPTYYVGRLNKKNSSITHNGDTMTGEEIYTYNNENLLSQIKKKGHLTNYLTEDNIYDVFGNITQKKITATGLTPRITNHTYDASGRFLLSNIDIENLTTNYSYSQDNGQLLTRTLPSNSGFPLTTTFTYDTWGKIIKETDYLGKSLYYSYSWNSPGSLGISTTTVTGDDNSASFTWYDDLGRKIAEGYRTINDGAVLDPKNSYKTYEYDINDRLKKAYIPQLALFPQWSGLFNETSFDEYGRPIQMTEHTGKVTNINYNGLATTTSDGVNNATIVKNSIGNIVSKTDNGGTITYQYYANGNLKQSDFAGVIISLEQDGWGRKTKLVDPSAGTYEYQYNEFGEVKKEITPKGETTYMIDDSGKITEKTIIGLAGDSTNNKTTFTYVNKLLTKTRYDDFTGGFFTLYNYGYDNYKRLNFSDESGFNAYYQRAIQFDDLGRPHKEFYTAINTTDGKRSDKWIRNSYKNGHHWQILDDFTNQILWEGSKMNANGQTLTSNYGNGITVTNTYDQYGFPTEFKHNKTVATSVIDVMTLNTSFESQRGNLISRNNTLFNYDETFTYDNLDRLTSWTDKSSYVNYNFSTTNEGFAVTNSNITMTHQLAQTRLYVSSNIINEGVKKVIFTNSQIGTNIEVKGSLNIRSASLGSVVKISILERNAVTGQVIETVKNYTLSLNTFTINHTVTQFNEISIKFSLSNVDPLNASIQFYLDNITVFNVKTNNQTYDTLGRIDDNNVGSYNYTNVNSTTSIPKHFQNSSIETNPEYQSYYLGRANLDITYNAFKSPIDILEVGKDNLSFIYNMNNGRSSMYYGGLQTDKYLRPLRKHYSTDGSMEIKQNIANGTVEFITYIGGDAYSAPVILKSDGTTQQYMYLHRDYLGSILAVTNQSGNIIEKRSFDAWGNIAKIQDGVGNNLLVLTVIDRGYTGHEHLQGVNLIHMNARLYDPVVHRFLQPDNFVQDPFNTQNFNRYSYVLNSPLKFTDASGEFAWVPVIIGAVIGAYSGAVIANGGQYNPIKWEWNMKTLGYIVGGAIVGGVSGGVANGVATSGVAFASTKAIIVGSMINGMGTHMYTGGKTDVTLSFGFASLNFSSGEFGYLFKKGNSFMGNFAFTLGAIANISDVLAGMNPGEVQLNTDTSDAIGHSAITEVGETDELTSLVSVGPDVTGKRIFNPFDLTNKADTNWHNYVTKSGTWKTIVKGVNTKAISNYSSDLANGAKYNLYFSSCVNHTARALTFAGVPTLGIHPFILHAQIYLRSIGFRPTFILTQYQNY